MHINEGTEILANLGILGSTEESPNRMKASKLEIRRTRSAMSRAAHTSSISDDSDDEIVFDRNALLNARKKRRRRRSSSIRSDDYYSGPESKTCKIICLCLTFLTMGMATVIIGLTKDDYITNNTTGDISDYTSIFIYGGFAYMLGSMLLSLVFTRLNAFIVITTFLITSIPISTLIIWQTGLTHIALLFSLQQFLFGAIERGSYFIVYGLWKGDRRVLFLLYTFFSLGAALSSLLCTETVFEHAKELKEIGEHKLVKRDLNAALLEVVPNNDTVKIDTVTEKPYIKQTRPQSALGINIEEAPKTLENLERRKQEQPDENSDKIVTVIINNTKIEETTTSTTSTTTSTTTTTTASTTTTSIPSTTTQSLQTPMPFVRSRNRISTNEPSIYNDVKNQVSKKLDEVKQKINEINTPPRFAYLLILIVTVITIISFVIGFCTCCLRCQMIADFRIAQLDLDSHQAPDDPIKIKVLTFILWFLQTTPESLSYSFLPYFILNTLQGTEKQVVVALFSFTFWIFVSFLRLILVARPSLSQTSTSTKIFYFLGIPTTFFLFNNTSSDAILFCGICSIAIFTITLSQLTMSWSQEKLQNSPFLLSRRFFLATSLSRSLIPWFTTKLMSNPKDTQSIDQVMNYSIICGAVCFYFVVKKVAPLAKQRHLKQLTGDLTGHPTAHYTKIKKNGPYEALAEDQSDADVEMELVIQGNVNSDYSSDSP